MEEDARREAAIASDLVPKSKKLTDAQLSKFQELHKRRLQIKSRSIAKKKIKGNGKSNEKKDGVITNTPNQKVSSEEEEGEDSRPSVSIFKPRKLHWGLDTKERWEMKANM